MKKLTKRLVRYLILLLCVITSRAHSQVSTVLTKDVDSVSAYTPDEDRNIARRLEELKMLRIENATLRLPAGYRKAQKYLVDSTVAVFVQKRAFLGIGLRRQKQQLVDALKGLP